MDPILRLVEKMAVNSRGGTKLNCKKVEDNLLEYLDGSLDTQSLEVIESHLATCDSCSHRLKILKVETQMLKSYFRWSNSRAANE
jgi:anti-sigma factor RsiW